MEESPLKAASWRQARPWGSVMGSMLVGALIHIEDRETHAWMGDESALGVFTGGLACPGARSIAFDQSCRDNGRNEKTKASRTVRPRLSFLAPQGTPRPAGRREFKRVR